MSVYRKANNGETNSDCCRGPNGPQSFNIVAIPTDTDLFVGLYGEDGRLFENVLLDVIQKLFPVEELVADVYADDSKLNEILNALILSYDGKSPCPPGYSRKFKVTINSDDKLCTDKGAPRPKVYIQSIDVGPCESPNTGGDGPIA